MSPAAPQSSPCRRSGAMKASVPAIISPVVVWVRWAALAMPRSASFAGPVRRISVARQALDRDPAVEHLVVAEEHRGHPATAEPAHHGVAVGKNHGFCLTKSESPYTLRPPTGLSRDRGHVRVPRPAPR